MPKPNITRTFGPIHFEDLDPHRFEDLVRELLYDYKDWQTIEATGRGGDDQGFDIRAYEKNVASFENSEDDEEQEHLHPMEGNLWKIQCKRESSIGPARVRQIIDEGVSKDNPPYGYILVASASFSRKSYDAFREELRNKGVMEFFLWGKAELEDLLHMPKYDRILFTFFGISLITAKRSKISSVRSFVQAKNKVMKIFGDNPAGQTVLFRNINDTYYPRHEKYPDFDKFPRWKQFVIQGYNATGFQIEFSSYPGYFDTEKKEWDFCENFNLNELDYSIDEIEDEGR